mmetsp:Transcript_46443/g.99465  ORF Transcript_46443/g.99465 Transcript_46443/m.99465 type:complete len:108 (-) Transcript_46443:429-752(-)
MVPYREDVGKGKETRLNSGLAAYKSMAARHLSSPHVKGEGCRMSSNADLLSLHSVKRVPTTDHIEDTDTNKHSSRRRHRGSRRPQALSSAELSSAPSSTRRSRRPSE